MYHTSAFTLIDESMKNLPVYMTGCGIDYLQNGIVREDGYPNFQWIQTYKGSGCLTVGHDTYTIAENTGFFLPPNIPHTYMPKSDVWIQDWIAFDGSHVENFLSTLGINKLGIYKTDKIGAIRTEIKNVLDLINSTESFKMFKSSYIIMKILSTIADAISEDSVSDSNRLKSVFTHIQACYNQDMTLSELANIVGISKQHLCRLFKAHLKMRPFEYIINTRIQKSKNLLHQFPSKTVDEISELVGFHSSSYFCTLFKKHEGITPIQFRKLN